MDERDDAVRFAVQSSGCVKRVPDDYLLSGSLPTELCGLHALTTVIIWPHKAVHDGHQPAISCTLECLSSKMDVHHQPPDGLPQCEVDTIHRPTLLQELDDVSAAPMPMRTSEGGYACQTTL